MYDTPRRAFSQGQKAGPPLLNGSQATSKTQPFEFGEPSADGDRESGYSNSVGAAPDVEITGAQAEDAIVDV